MEARIDRRAPDVHRIPLDVLVQLTHEDYEEPFDADGVDVSAGGLALRADYLPEVGDRLRCRFDCPPDGAEVVELDGEVVWAHDAGERSGEFGLRFAELDGQAEAALRRMLAPSDGGERGVGPRARLHLDAVATPIDADVIERTESSLSVEQELPFLRIGMGVVVEGSGPAHGRLASVELRLRDGVPRLLLRVEDSAADRAPEASAAVEASAVEAPTELVPYDDDATLQDHPTLPDLTGEETPVVSMQAAALDALIHRSAVPEAAAPATMETRPAPRAEETRGSIEARAPLQSGWAKTREAASALVRQTRPKLTELWAKLTAWVAALLENVGPHAKRGWEQVRASVDTLKTRVARVKGKRRTTSAPPTRVAQAPRRRQQRRAPEAAPKKMGRLMLLAVLAFAGAGAGVYALIASGAPASAPAEQASAPAADSALAAPVEAPALPEPAAADVEAAAPPESVGGQLEEPTYPTLREAARHAPVESPVQEGTSFGAEEVPNGQTTTLRMSQPVTTLRGESQSDGFTVTIPGSLALDGARGLAASNPHIDQSMILNRGDHAVLTIRFVEGRTPAYRVEARGSAIAITISN